MSLSLNRTAEKRSQDVDFGITSENAIQSTIETFFNDTLTKTPQFDSVDWEGESGAKYELKSRKVFSTTYPTTILPVSKVKAMESSKGFCIFRFLDKIKYILYTKEVFDTFEICDVYCNGFPRKHYHIPIEKLIDIYNFEVFKVIN